MKPITEKFKYGHWQWLEWGGLQQGKKLLHLYHYELDETKVVEELGIQPVIFTNSLNCVNFIIDHCVYRSDRIRSGYADDWPESSDRVYEILQQKFDDCDGLAITGASLMDLGGIKAHICVGWYGPQPKYQVNHAFILVPDGQRMRVGEVTGNIMTRELPFVENSPMHHPLLSATAEGDYFAHGLWENYL